MVSATGTDSALNHGTSCRVGARLAHTAWGLPTCSRPRLPVQHQSGRCPHGLGLPTLPPLLSCLCSSRVGLAHTPWAFPHIRPTPTYPSVHNAGGHEHSGSSSSSQRRRRDVRRSGQQTPWADARAAACSQGGDRQRGNIGGDPAAGGGADYRAASIGGCGRRGGAGPGQGGASGGGGYERACGRAAGCHGGRMRRQPGLG